jgi:hypothetical protein
VQRKRARFTYPKVKTTVIGGEAMPEDKKFPKIRELFAFVKNCHRLGIIADNLSKAGWTWGCISTVDSNGRTIWIADAHRDNGKAFRCARGGKADCVYGTRISDSG